MPRISRVGSVSAAAIPSFGASVYSLVKQGGSHLWAEGEGPAWPSPWWKRGAGGRAAWERGRLMRGSGFGKQVVSPVP